VEGERRRDVLSKVQQKDSHKPIKQKGQGREEGERTRSKESDSCSLEQSKIWSLDACGGERRAVKPPALK
jgi:hypothetical protein